MGLRCVWSDFRNSLMRGTPLGRNILRAMSIISEWLQMQNRVCKKSLPEVDLQLVLLTSVDDLVLDLQNLSLLDGLKEALLGSGRHLDGHLPLEGALRRRGEEEENRQQREDERFVHDVRKADEEKMVSVNVSYGS